MRAHVLVHWPPHLMGQRLPKRLRRDFDARCPKDLPHRTNLNSAAVLALAASSLSRGNSPSYAEHNSGN